MKKAKIGRPRLFLNGEAARLNLTLPAGDYAAFRERCDLAGLKPSAMMRLMIRDFNAGGWSPAIALARVEDRANNTP